MRLRRISLLFLLTLLIPACSEKPPVAQKDFVNFYVQLQFMDVQYGKDPSLQKTKIDSLKHAFNLNDRLIDSTLSWYGQKPERWEEFSREVRERLAQLRKDYVRSKK